MICFVLPGTLAWLGLAEKRVRPGVVCGNPQQYRPARREGHPAQAIAASAEATSYRAAFLSRH
jgi:hypothetical protein